MNENWSTYVGLGVDPAASAKRTADFSCVVVAAFTTLYEPTTYQVEVPSFTGRTMKLQSRTKVIGRRQMNIIDVHRMRVEIPVLVDRLAQIQRQWRAIAAVESVGGFRSVSSYLRRANPSLRVFDVHRTVDKITASIPCAASWARGDIKLPPSAPWLPEFMREISSFVGAPSGGGRFDDQVDGMVTAQQLGDYVIRTDRDRQNRARVHRALANLG